MKIGGKLRVILIVIVAVIAVTLALIFWAYVDVMRYNELAIRDVNLQNIANGVYEGSFKGGRFSNSVAVKVRDHAIVNIKELKSSTSQKDVRQKIYSKVIENQSLKIDTVSGATVTTLTTLKTIENALSQ
jgi:uncharacterized protein with FMN-binding domain